MSDPYQLEGTAVMKEIMNQCPKCGRPRTQDEDEMGSVCPTCLYDKDNNRVIGT